MSTRQAAHPALLSKINERHVLRTLQQRGALSRAEVARMSGMSAPTAAKAVESLLKAGLLEEGDARETSRGRPGKKLWLARQTTQVLGLVVDADRCRLVAAGIDGALHAEHQIEFVTPSTYDDLLAHAQVFCRELMAREGIATAGLAICLPGMVDYRRGRSILSPNVPVTNEHTPAQDLGARLGIDAVIIQESHALCLGERHFGNARNRDDFAMLDITTGIGLGVMSGGRLLTGHSGLAGEIGHITVELDGRQCGCGNFGCLETVASDAGLAWAVSQKLGRRVSVDEVIELILTDEQAIASELIRTIRYLAVGLAAVINLFNPSTLFVHSRMIAASEKLFERLIEETCHRTLPPSYTDCEIILAQSSKRQGAIAAIIEHLTNAGLPSVVMPSHFPPLHTERC
jgi:predicted NBD/HSP70 family sugar kinase